jgi:alkylated DNA repair dioxygenase AlkB
VINAEKIILNDGILSYYPSFLDYNDSIRFFNLLENEIEFEQHAITIFGKTHLVPRLESFHAKEKKTYTYSGNTLIAKPFNQILKYLCSKIEKVTNSTFNCVLINYYRNGMDSNGWHSDNEKELGENPIVASLSLGASRRFDLKHNSKSEKFSIDLHNGDLLWMNERIQNFYKHQIAKSKRIMEPRINLTFRFIK